MVISNSNLGASVLRRKPSIIKLEERYRRARDTLKLEAKERQENEEPRVKQFFKVFGELARIVHRKKYPYEPREKNDDDKKENVKALVESPTCEMCEERHYVLYEAETDGFVAKDSEAVKNDSFNRMKCAQGPAMSVLGC
ncbi:2727_t:CDS:2 [Paraglomus brasilianum]|uniref:2727_t:CDS:1 n=1 Tax=Paraglomus brasilianum TaxID=144538 RepID=A0A9N9G0W1_9GLOM|nr:2727_t:CDS:2 [Paraglomus brasilianum]